MYLETAPRDTVTFGKAEAKFGGRAMFWLFPCGMYSVAFCKTKFDYRPNLS